MQNAKYLQANSGLSDPFFFCRFCELSDWLSSQRRQVRLLRETAIDSSHQEQLDAAVQVSLCTPVAGVDTEIML